MQPPERHEVDQGRKEDKDDDQAPVPAARFTPDEEAALLQQSSRQKTEANHLFGSAQYSQAIGEYDKALSSCPNYLGFEIAVLKSNISACHLKLEDWKAAIDSATAALDALDSLEPRKRDEERHDDGVEDHAVVEIEAEGSEAEKALAGLAVSDQRREDIRRIRSKALMRRARAKSEQGGWANLQGAEEDYRELNQFPNLPAKDKKIVHRALSSLPARINVAKETEMGEMMGKLKQASAWSRPFP
ncbi:MAG: hypothetical protein HETSPECPRED_003063 [Heterodermia speciosa]|uniref:Tetratricopeptide repeat protein 1 n=1 Tax=Heterodermia speciosa TaxID=116794 RepID=A0A8H3F7G0_9LECA|nr:MAG: hypothetical protein HETSPECPRED_003063 [Heterodermia speciosa]